MARFSGSSPPRSSDFSEGAVKKAIWKEILQKPITLWPAAVGIVAGAAILIIDPSLIAFLIAGGGVGIGLSSFLANIARRKSLANHYLKKLHEKLLRQRQEVLENLEDELKDCVEKVPDAEEHARQGVMQLEIAQERFGVFKEIISEKLDTTELTYVRFTATAEQVYLSILDNLRQVANLLRSVSSIDSQYISSRLAALNKLKKKEKADEDEIKTLIERQNLRDSQLNEINNLLARNEEALTLIDKTTAAAATMKIEDGATIDWEVARQELEAMVRRVSKTAQESFIK